MAREPWVESLLPVAARFKQVCLIRDGSLFVPHRPIWTTETIEDFQERFAEDTSSDSFDTKLKRQLEDAADATALFAAELYFVNLLAESDTGVATKRQHIDVALSFTEGPETIPDELVPFLSAGIATLGQAKNKRDGQFRFIMALARRIKELPESERRALFDDPWAYRDFQLVTPKRGAGYQLEAFLFLFFPEVFEPIVSSDGKAKIVKAYSEYVEFEDANVDEKLFEIRRELEPEYGDLFNFYAPDIRPVWDRSLKPTGRAWLVRGANNHGENMLPVWFEQGFASIGWPDPKPFPLPPTPESIRAEIAARRPRVSRGAAARGFGIIKRFTSIREGDYIVSPDSKNVYVGVATGEPYWDDERDDAALRVSVRWLTVDAPADRAELQERVPSLRTRLKTLLTVSDLSADAAAIAALVGGDEDEEAWEPFLYWAGRLFAHESFDAEERDYKLTVGQNMAAAREALDGGSDSWFDLLRAAFGQPNNLTSWRAHAEFLDWCAGNRDAARSFLEDLWGRESLEPSGVAEIVAAWPVASNGVGNRLSILSVLFLGVDPNGHPPYKTTPVEKALRLIGLPTRGIPADADEQPATDKGLLSEEFDGVPLRKLRSWVKFYRDPEQATDAELERINVESKHPGFTREDHIRVIQAEIDARGAWGSSGSVDLGPNDIARQLGVAGSSVRHFLRKAFPRPEELRNTNWGALSPEQREAVYEHFGRPSTDNIEDAGRRYGAFLSLLDEIVARLRDGGVELRDRLDAQGLVWWIATSGPPDEWSDEDKAAFLAYQGEKEEVVDTDLRALSQELFLEPAEWLEEVVALLLEKGQAIFYGPPGTGKTFVAQALARHLIRNGGGFDLIQFHPSYSYEDFFEGYRPRTDGGQLSYVLTPGPLRLMAARAQADPDNPYVLIVDEINRGNVAKIFGELLFLLEYRKKSVTLQYSAAESFSLPPNLYVIGTMNTADRSIALVDAALRRRFYFVEFSPAEEPVINVLKLWLDKNGFSDESDTLLRELNRRISETDRAIGPSYFMTDDGSEPNIDRIWRYAIIPLLEEYFYGTGIDAQEEYGLEQLRSSLSGEPEVEPETEEAPSL